MTTGRSEEGGAAARICAVLLPLLLLAGCQSPKAQLEPSGTLDVLAPFFVSAGGASGGEWIVEGEPDVAPVDSGTSLRLQTGGKGYVVVRHLDTPLLTSPYLGWSWNVTAAQAADRHPVRLVVGFAGGVQKRPPWATRLLRSIDSPLPEHDRVVHIAWGASALERGHLILPAGETGIIAASMYIARGGAENSGQWWRETVDLSEIYRRSWPDDDAKWARIVFAGFVVDAAPMTAARFAAITLTR